MFLSYVILRWRADAIISPPPPHLSNKPLVSTKPPSNGLEINKPPPGGGGG